MFLAISENRGFSANVWQKSVQPTQLLIAETCTAPKNDSQVKNDKSKVFLDKDLDAVDSMNWLSKFVHPLIMTRYNFIQTLFGHLKKFQGLLMKTIKL